jgi:hypothetical protein
MAVAVEISLRSGQNTPRCHALALCAESQPQVDPGLSVAATSRPHPGDFTDTTLPVARIIIKTKAGRDPDLSSTADRRSVPDVS